MSSDPFASRPTGVRTGPATRSGRLLLPLFILLAVILLAAVTVSIVAEMSRSGLLEGTPARQDADALAEVVAAHIKATEQMPRVTASVDYDGSWPIWGAHWLIEGRRVDRADPGDAVPYFVVGTADSWCIEVAHFPDATLFDSAPIEWTSVVGSGGTVDERQGGRCEGYLLHGTPAVAPPAPVGSVIPIEQATAGTCTTWVYEPSQLAGDLAATGTIEVVDCSLPHRFELVEVGWVSQVDPQIEEGRECEVAFLNYVGVPHTLSSLNLEGVWSPPTADGEIAYGCLVWDATETYDIVGSVRDTWF